MTENYLMKVVSKYFLDLKYDPEPEHQLKNQYNINRSKDPLSIINNNIKNSVV